MYIREVDRLDEIAEIPRDAELVGTIKELVAHFADAMHHQCKSPYTLIHHDYHLGNLIFVETNGATKALVLDWQDLSVVGQRMSPSSWARVFRSKVAASMSRRYSGSTTIPCVKVVSRITPSINVGKIIGWGCLKHCGGYVLLFGLRLMQGAAYIELRDVFAPRIYAAVVDLNSREALSRLG